MVLRFDRERNLAHWRDSEERNAWTANATELAEALVRYADIPGTAQAQPLVLALTPHPSPLISLQESDRTSVSGIGLLLLSTVAALVTLRRQMLEVPKRLVGP